MGDRHPRREFFVEEQGAITAGGDEQCWPTEIGGQGGDEGQAGGAGQTEDDGVTPRSLAQIVITGQGAQGGEEGGEVHQQRKVNSNDLVIDKFDFFFPIMQPAIELYRFV